MTEATPQHRCLRHWVYIPPALAAVFTLFAVYQSLQWPRYNIPSGSMEPTLQIGDVFLVHVLGRDQAPQRGDLMVFRDRARSIDYVKRITGLPSDRVRLQDGALFINGAAIERTALGEESSGRGLFRLFEEVMPDGHRYRVKLMLQPGRLETMPEIVVPEGRYHVLGDNRDNSSDSRDSFVGFVGRDDLVGRPRLIVFSYSPQRIFQRLD